MYYLRARQYDTVIGRFMQEDTYLGDGRNLYMYVSNNPLKYVDPSGHDKTLGYTYNLHLNLTLGSITNRREQAEKNLIWDGVAETTKGVVQTVSGGMVTAASVPVMAVNPLVGITTGAIGVGYANMGLSNTWEGIQKIYNGATGNISASTFNATRDIFFGGNQQYFNQAELVLGVSNLASGIVLPMLPGMVVTSGNVAAYAEAANQTSDFLETVGDAVERDAGATNTPLTFEQALEKLEQCGLKPGQTVISRSKVMEIVESYDPVKASSSVYTDATGSYLVEGHHTTVATAMLGRGSGPNMNTPTQQLPSVTNIHWTRKWYEFWKKIIEVLE